MTKVDIVRKLTSRKLWMAIAGFVSMLMVFFKFSENEAAQVAALIMAGADVIGYMVAEGLADSGRALGTLEAIDCEAIKDFEDK